MGPPGSGKSFLGCELAEQGVAAFVSLGEQAALHAHLAEIGSVMLRSCFEQLREQDLVVALEAHGSADRALLEGLQCAFRVALVRVDAERELCIERVVSRAAERHLHAAADPDAVGRFYDAWRAQIAPTYAFDLAVDGTDVDHASAGIRSFLSCRGF